MRPRSTWAARSTTTRWTSSSAPTACRSRASTPSASRPCRPSFRPQLPIDGAAFEGVNLDLFDVGGAAGIDLPALPAVDAVSLPALPALPSTDDLALPSVDSLPIAGALAALPVALPDLPAVGSLPAVGDVALPSLPTVGDLALPSLPAVGDLALPSLPAVGEPAGRRRPGPAVPAGRRRPASLPSLPGTDALPSLPALPDAVGTVTGLAGGLPTSAALDLDSVSGTVTDALPASADVFSATDLVQGLI